MIAYVKIVDKKELKQREESSIGWNNLMSDLMGKYIEVEYIKLYDTYLYQISDRNWEFAKDWLDFSTSSEKYIKEL